ncbi:protein translocase subunit SecDF [Chitinophaga sp. SYP-B3965]|uniref:protein translocase subunit SecDF n=1 Tax=Chitinophaga sp. SYP-B3965 TaxID=2663120 RepID=UPI001299EAED|nr:protein translocase subunit SecDF [Chitinophaga sp. SYP-B3965]MRG45632.1 protein translocase subunit SecDF [Chitinophaga sp. SYP-B3965]
MQLKGLVRFFAVALILISLYQLSFTFVVRNYEKKIKTAAEAFVAGQYPTAEQKHAGNKEAQALYADTLNDLIKERTEQMLDSASGKQIAGFPWFTTYTSAKEKQLNLGLDLQGGMNVVLEVSVEDVVRSLSGHSKDPAFNNAIKKAIELKKNSQSDFVTLFGEAYKQEAPNGKLASIFANAQQKQITFNSTNDQVLNVIRNESKAAIKNTYKVLQNRIDKFGVASPSINLDENRGIISVELAGVDDADRVRKYLQASANLEFRETYKSGEEFYLTVLQPMNEAIKISQGIAAKKDSAAPVTATDSAATAAAAPAKDSAASLTSLLAKDSGLSKLGGDSAKQMDALRAEQVKQNPLFAIFIPNVNDQNQIMPSSMLGRIFPKDTATFRRYIETPGVKAILPKDLVFVYGPTKREDRTQPLPVYGIKVNPANPQARITGERVTAAKADFGQNHEVEVSMSMDNVGTRDWRNLTRALKPSNPQDPRTLNYVAIVLDNVVYSAPSINSEIPNGNSSISGSFSLEEATDLANILVSGRMPAPAKIVQEQVVGPTLGQESIQAGAKSFIISFIVIFILMLVYFNTGGWVANIALILNLLFTVGILASLGATLTMPGIAGLVLTIGMAVDTNVIIFERIKDELSRGKTYQQAVEDGYKRSYAPVLDGHITSLLTACILFYFGLGPVLGFATTQIIGILLSLFCGILVSRMITDWWTNKKRHLEYFTPISRRIFKHANYNFVGMRKYTYVISGIVLILGIGSFFHGFDHGVDFSGGRSYTVRFEKPVNAEEVRKKLSDIYGSETFVKTIGGKDQLNITTPYKIDDNSDAAVAEVKAKLYEGLKGQYAGNIDEQTFLNKYIVGSQTVLPTISDDLRAGAVKATILSLIVIFLYILLRFSKWQYSIGTIFSLLHDVLVTLAVFSFCRTWVPFSLEIDQHFIAAILTVIGFSMNDTVIVFDRIRENFRLLKGADTKTVINRAINDTLSRTIMTSVTVFLTILILFIFGGEVTRGFAFAMLIGVITGAYSSIFVAAPVLVDFDKKNTLSNEKEAVVVQKAPPLVSGK